MIEKRLIDTLNHLFPPRASYAVKSSMVDGYGYEPQMDGSFKIYDSEGNEIAIVWRDEAGNVTGYDDLVNGQCVEVPEDGYYAEDGSCNPEEQSCWFYHDETSQTQNASQRFAEDAPVSTTSEQQTTSTKPKKSQQPADVTEDHSPEGITVPSHDVETSRRSSGTLAVTETVQPQVQPTLTVEADIEQVMPHGAPVTIIMHDEQVRQEQASKDTHPMDSGEDVPAAVVQSGVMFGTAPGTSEEQPDAMASLLSDLLEIFFSESAGQFLAAGVQAPVSEEEVAEPSMTASDFQISGEAAPEVAHVQAVAGDQVVQEVSFVPESVRISEPGVGPLSADTAVEGMEFAFIGSPMFFMPASDGAPLAAVMSANQRAGHEVHNVGARGNPPDHQDGQGSSGRDEGHDESEEEEEETIPV